MDILKEAFIRSVTGEISLRTTLATVSAFFGSAARHITHDASVAGILKLIAGGSDSNVDIQLTPKGTGGVVIDRLGVPLPTGRIQSPVLMSEGWVGKVKSDVSLAGISFLAAAPNGKLYVRSGATVVSVFNPAKNLFETNITTSNGAQGVAYCPSNNRIYVACTTSGEISVINPDTNTVVATIVSVVGVRTPAYVPSVDRIYVTNDTTGDVVVINPATNTVVTTIAAGARYGIAYCPTNTHIYVGALTGVAVINPSTNTLVTTVALGGESRGVCYCPLNNRIYASAYSGGTVHAIDPFSNTSVASITVGTNPFEVRFNPQNGLLYVANFGASSLSIIRPASNVAERTVATGAGCVGIAYLPHDGLMYVTAQTAGAIHTFS